MCTFRGALLTLCKNTKNNLHIHILFAKERSWISITDPDTTLLKLKLREKNGGFCCLMPTNAIWLELLRTWHDDGDDGRTKDKQHFAFHSLT